MFQYAHLVWVEAETVLGGEHACGTGVELWFMKPASCDRGGLLVRFREFLFLGELYTEAIVNIEQEVGVVAGIIKLILRKRPLAQSERCIFFLFFALTSQNFANK